MLHALFLMSYEDLGYTESIQLLQATYAQHASTLPAIGHLRNDPDLPDSEALDALSVCAEQLEAGQGSLEQAQAVLLRLLEQVPHLLETRKRHPTHARRLG